MPLIVQKQNLPLCWTEHAKQKMRFYGLSAARLKRVLRHPERVEEGIAPRTVALMQPAQPKHASEIWLMYQKRKQQMIIITAWRYPGKSPLRAVIPIPEEIRRELGFV